MQSTLLIINLILGLLLTLLILMQEKGEGFGEAIGGSGGGGGFQTTKRGAELLLAKLTVLFFILFVGLSLALNFV